MPARRLTLLLLTAAMVISISLFSGCGEDQEGSITEQQHGQIEKGMTLDDVEAVVGKPYRTHRTGSSQDPDIVWYYRKTDGEGLVRVSFESAKVETVTPYDESIDSAE